MPTDLTKKMQDYCIHRATGNNRLQSYRLAYDAENMTNNSCNTAAWRLEQRPEIREEIDRLERMAARATSYTLEKHIRELDRLATEAEREGNFGAATQCRVAMGKACGLYTDQIRVEGEGLAPDALLRQIQATDPAAAQAIAQAIGIPLDGPVKH